MWLVTCPEDRAVDLKALGELLDAGRFSFGSAQRLMTHLGVRPGAVTPFAVIKDKAGAVTIVLDSAVMAGGPVNCPPLVHPLTTVLAPAGPGRLLVAYGLAALMLGRRNAYGG